MLNECGVEVACSTVLEKRQLILGLTRAFRDSGSGACLILALVPILKKSLGLKYRRQSIPVFFLKFYSEILLRGLFSRAV